MHATDPPVTPAPTVRQAISSYLEHLTATEATADRRQVVAVALATLLEPVLDEPIGTLTNLRLVLLCGEIKGRISPKTGRPLATSTFRRYVLAGQEFYIWAAQKWPRAVGGPSAAPAQLGPGGHSAKPEGGHSAAPQQHLGELIRLLRTGANLTRQQLGTETKLGEMAIKNIELRRRLPTRRQLDRLTAAPCMARLLAWAEREGIPIELAPDNAGTGSGSGGSAAPLARGGGPGDDEGGSGGSGVGGAP